MTKSTLVGRVRNFRLPPAQAALLTLALAVMFCLVLAMVHFRQVSILERVQQDLARLRDTEADVAFGLLAVTLGQEPGSLYTVAQGLERLDRVRESVEVFSADWPQVFPGSLEMEGLVAEFQRRTAPVRALAGGAPGSSRSHDLQVAFFQVEQTVDRIELLAARSRTDLSQKLNTDFLFIEGVGLALMIVLSMFLFVQGSARQRAESRLAQVLKGTNVGLWHRDLISGQKDATETWKTMTGMDKFGGPHSWDTWAKLIHPEDRAWLLKGAQEFENSEEGEFSAEYRIETPGGGTRWLLTLVTATRDSRGKVTDLYGTSLDITDRKRLEIEKETLTAQILQAQKTQAVGRLAGGIAHDINNLLVPLLAYSELGIQGLGKKSSTEYFVHIKAGVERAARLTKQILAFTRQQVLERQPLDLNALVTSFESMLRRTIRENIDVRIVLGAGLPAILADQGQVEQVLLNLAVNAQDAMPEGGTLTIETRCQGLEGACEDPESPGRSHVVLGVLDTGCGIPEGVLDHIFEPFFTTKARGEGTGLGLSTVQGIVEQHGGHLRVTSAVGTGSQFLVFWPATGAEVTEISEQVKPAGGTETLLVVEDDGEVRAVVCDALRSGGYRVLSTARPEEALTILDAYDLLITDVIMPGLNGRELHQALRVPRPGLKVLYLSGYPDQILEDSQDALQGFLQKPFSMDTLQQKVRELLDRQI